MRAGLRLSTAAANASIAGQVRAVGAGAGRDLGMTVEQQRDVLALHHRCQHLDAVDQVALGRGLEPEQHRGDVGRRNGIAEHALQTPSASSMTGVTR